MAVEPESIGQVLRRCPTPGPMSQSASTENPEQREARIADLRRRQEQATLLQRAGVDPRHLKKSVEELRRHGEWAAMEKRAWDLLMVGAPILAFLGDRGNGKTQAAVTLIRRAAYDLKPARYLRCRQVSIDVRATYRPDAVEQEADVIRALAQPWLLVLDECQEGFGTPHELQTLTMLLDMRYGACRPTVLIANCSEEAFKDLMGPAIIDRLHEGGKALMFTWDSFRV